MLSWYTLNLNYWTGKLADGATRNVPCTEIHSGRFLSIYLDHPGILALCEVQVLSGKFMMNIDNAEIP